MTCHGALVHSPVGVVSERRSTGFSTGPPRTDPLRTARNRRSRASLLVKRGSLAPDPDPDWLPSTHSVADLGHLMSWIPMASPFPTVPAPTGPAVMNSMNQPTTQLLLPLPPMMFVRGWPE